MKKSFYLSGALAAVTALALGACATAAPSSDEPTEPPAATPGSTQVEKTLYIGPSLVDCTGVAPQKCMLVKEKPEDPYQLFYNQIEGFELEEGYEYELIVRVEEIENPPADASNLKYTLVEVVNKSPASPTPNPEVSMPTQTYKLDWYLNSQGEQIAVLPGTEISLAFMDGRIAGNSGCNQYSGSVQVDGNKIQVGPMISTLMACEEPIMMQEQAYLAALGGAASFETAGETLTLADAQGKPILSFSTLQPAPLVGTQWSLVAYNNGKEAIVSVVNGTSITANFDLDGRLSGLAGCNNYTAGYEVDGDKMTIGPAAATRKFCGQEGVMEQEMAYLLGLEKVAGFKIEGEMLTLYDADGNTYMSYSATKPVALAGTDWNLIAFNNGKEAFVSVILGTTISASFGEDGKLSGSAGCNTYSADYTVDGEQISIGPAISTRMFCAEEGVMDQEMQYLMALEKATSYKIEGDLLTLFDASGVRMADYLVPGSTQ